MSQSSSAPGRKPVRVWVDGCFDMMHFGHANFLRQAKDLCDVLVVGVHNDEEITLHKGPPVMNYQERLAVVSACKWADEIVENAPYVTSLDIMDTHQCEYCIHGDDLTTDSEGNDSYAAVKAAGRFRVVPRTRGASTTDLVGRLLLHTKEHHVRLMSGPNHRTCTNASTGLSPQFMPSARLLASFTSGARQPGPQDRIVYMDGSFDMLHAGHIRTLHRARELGDYLIVGVYEDQVVNSLRGESFPVMNLYERVLALLSCRVVDEVIMGAPYGISEATVREMNIHRVVHGSLWDTEATEDPYLVPKRLGVFVEVPSDEQSLTTEEIVDRVISNHMKYRSRNQKKEDKDRNARIAAGVEQMTVN